MTGWTWGFPAKPTQNPTVEDEALLIQWPATGLDPGVSAVIGSFSYGSAACEPICSGNLFAMLLHTDHIKWNGSEYVPNRFPVDAIVWNGQTTPASSSMGTQSITNDVTGIANGPVQIVASNSPFYSDQHNMLGSTVGAKQSSSITWEDTVLASVLTNCSTDSLYNIAFSVQAGGVGATSCSNGTYVCPVMVDCQGKPPAVTPMTTVLSRTGSYNKSLCNMRCTDVVAFDTGATRIPVLSVSANSLLNMTLSIAPNHVGADSTFYSVCVVDSMMNGTASIKVTDSIGNSTIEQYSYCTIPDTNAPKVKLGFASDTCGSCFNIVVSDTQAWDRGVDTIRIYDTINVTIDTISPNGDFVFGPLANVFFHLTDPKRAGHICIIAFDYARNFFDTCFTFEGNASTSTFSPAVISLAISPNPTSEDVSIFIDGVPSANVEIFDVLGREVDHFRMNGSYDWQTAALPAGTYIVRAVVHGEGTNAQVITKRIVKE